ncbi:MAG: DUF4268 domain-containing protein, partial [Bacteroidota bacterium]
NEADNKFARVCIDIQHPDPGLRDLFYDQWEEFQHMLHTETEAEWIWLREHVLETGKEISRIYVEHRGWNIYLQKDWGDLFRFFAGIMVPLDGMWGFAYEVFKDLEG